MSSALWQKTYNKAMVYGINRRKLTLCLKLKCLPPNSHAISLKEQPDRFNTGITKAESH